MIDEIFMGNLLIKKIYESDNGDFLLKNYSIKIRSPKNKKILAKRIEKPMIGFNQNMVIFNNYLSKTDIGECIAKERVMKMCNEVLEDYLKLIVKERNSFVISKIEDGYSFLFKKSKIYNLNMQDIDKKIESGLIKIGEIFYVLLSNDNERDVLEIDDKYQVAKAEVRKLILEENIKRMDENQIEKNRKTKIKI